MSKKKACSGSTMSLKDFHGGSIPFDFNLPSSPGVLVRSNSDRQISTTWGNTIGRYDYQSRPKSSSAADNFDYDASFFSHPVNDGRKFDEDERTPLDGGSATRQRENIYSKPPIPQDMKLGYVSAIRNSDRQVTNAVAQSQSVTNGRGQGGTTSHPDAWVIIKEVMGGGDSSLSGSEAVSKFAQASAVDKVSSGKWQYKSRMQLLPHLLYSNRDDKSSGVALLSERPNSEATGGSHAGNSEDGVHGSDKEMPNNERERHSIVKEEESMVHSELSERPKLKLLPRTKRLDTLEKDYKQPSDSEKLETVGDTYANACTPKQGLTVGESGNRPAERPKLNLKPRSQAIGQLVEQSEGNTGRDRSALFGGGRPRELVLKERGVDTVAINKLNPSHAPNRLKAEATSDHLHPTARHIDRIVNLALEKRTGFDSETKNQCMDVGKEDIQTKNWQNNWKGSRDAIIPQQNRQPEPDTWRKPIEQPKLASSDASSISYGKVASALELAQAFSRSISDPKATNRLSDQKGLSGQNQMLFSQLTDN